MSRESADFWVYSVKDMTDNTAKLFNPKRFYYDLLYSGLKYLFTLDWRNGRLKRADTFSPAKNGS